MIDESATGEWFVFFTLHKRLTRLALNASHDQQLEKDPESCALACRLAVSRS